jgi:hypothetical protein
LAHLGKTQPPAGPHRPEARPRGLHIPGPSLSAIPVDLLPELHGPCCLPRHGMRDVSSGKFTSACFRGSACLASMCFIYGPRIGYSTLVTRHIGVDMGKLIGYARVSTRQQDADRQVSDLLNAGVRRDDLYVDSGVSGGRASRPAFDCQSLGAGPGVGSEVLTGAA